MIAVVNSNSKVLFFFDIGSYILLIEACIVVSNVALSPQSIDIYGRAYEYP